MPNGVGPDVLSSIYYVNVAVPTRHPEVIGHGKRSELSNRSLQMLFHLRESGDDANGHYSSNNSGLDFF